MITEKQKRAEDNYDIHTSCTDKFAIKWLHMRLKKLGNTKSTLADILNITEVIIKFH